MLPRRRAQGRHAAVARLGEERFGDRPGSFAVVMAHHWKEAGNPERAIEHLMVAAEQADQSWAKQEAVSALQRGAGPAARGRPATANREATTGRRAATIAHIRFGDVAVSQEVLEGLTSQPGKSAGET